MYFCGNSSVLFMFFGPWAKDFWPFVGKFFAGLLKLHSENRCHQFREKLFVYERSILVLAVSDNERICFGPLLKTFWRDCDNCLQCLQKNIFTKNFFSWKKIGLIFFSDLELNVLEFCRKTEDCRRSCENCFLRAHTNVFFSKK